VVELRGKAQGKSPQPARGGTVAALDIGSSKISCLIAEVTPAKSRQIESTGGNDLRLRGVGHQLSRGVRGGAVVDVDAAERAIRLAVDAAERMAGQTISEVHVNVSGGRPSSKLYVAAEATQTGQVSPRDIERVIANAMAQVDPGRRKVLHATPVQYQLDAARGVKSPLGMYGEKLGVELGVVTVEPAHLHNLMLVIERAHLNAASFVVAPYAAAKSVLAPDEGSLGVTLIDMGGATTSFAIFFEGNLVHADMVALGGQHITNDIARGLSTTIAHAERMKTLWGSALAAQVDERDMVSVPLLGEKGFDAVQQIPKSMLAGIIRPRIEETFELIRDKIEASGLRSFAGRRVVLTGGASQLTGVREVAAQWLDRQVRLGTPEITPGIPDSIANGGFAVAAGLLNHALKPDAQASVPKSENREQLVAGGAGYMRKMGRWIAESL